MVRFRYNNGSVVGLPKLVANQLQLIKSGVILDDDIKKESKPKTKRKVKK